MLKNSTIKLAYESDYQFDTISNRIILQGVCDCVRISSLIIPL